MQQKQNFKNRKLNPNQSEFVEISKHQQQVINQRLINSKRKKMPIIYNVNS